MPIREYECISCRERVEKLDRKISEVPAQTCERCGAVMQLRASPFIFKLLNPFTTDGEGFSSVKYRRDEFRHREKHNLSKYDTV